SASGTPRTLRARSPSTSCEPAARWEATSPRPPRRRPRSDAAAGPAGRDPDGAGALPGRPRARAQGHGLGAGRVPLAGAGESPRPPGHVLPVRRPRLGWLPHRLDDRLEDLGLLADPHRMVAAPLHPVAPRRREGDGVVPPRPRPGELPERDGARPAAPAASR